MEIFTLDISGDIPNDVFFFLLEKIPNEKKRKILKFRHRADAKRSLYSELLLRYLIRKKLGILEEHIVFNTNKYGKPFLIQSKTALHFNLSHSGNWVVCALDSYPVGIDIEEIRPIDFSLANRFFSPKEVLELNVAPEGKKLSKFYALWTLKESYIKAVGKGLSIPLDSFSILTKNIDTPELSDKHKTGLYFFKQYDIDSKYKLSVCAKHFLFPDQVTMINQLLLQEGHTP
ncbi:4'-phosphopantetheinyl transferase family protein [Cytobacillus purgationiresistens]|uniref:4'-phosphopantetheinyl transferase n=1 Tax=Cytobacillus purgationiresistens TaxID=863449 RepID=A0ABU0AR13_9BACI|nr:4'-phosphopantetheinyl transferase superfamily protein [Cytobacillus purgationiresistens]MDQ0273721.1 4'-phosphopantetheinyl transferase [Cytobacillus purgationiresistens]